MRWLSRAPGLVLAVIATLAVSIGALTTAFGMVHAAILRQPPFLRPDELTIVYTTHTARGEGPHNERWSYARALRLRELAGAFAQVANYSGSELTLTGTDETEPVRGEFVSPTYFRALSVGPVLGRAFHDTEDDVAGAHPIVILSHDFWQRRFGGDPQMVGKAIGLNGRSLTVIGVMPPAFRGLTDRAQLWIPTTMAPVLTYADYLVTDQNFINVVARLKPGTTVAGANAELQTLGPRIYAELPDVEADSSDHAGAVARSLNEARVHPDVREAVLLLLGAVALLHLLACANVTSLLLGRAVSRHRESAVRTALGSSPRALFRLHFAEGALLAGVGGLLGTLFALRLGSRIGVPTDVWGPRNFYGSLAAFATPEFSWTALVFGLVLTAVSALLVASVPAATALRGDLLAGLREGARGSSAAAGSLRRPSARGVIVGIETALAVVLLVAGGLMIDSFARMLRTDLGVDPRQVLSFSLMPSDVRVPTDQAPAFIARMLEAIQAVPGVVTATVDGGAPVSGTARSVLFIGGRPQPGPGDAPPVLRHYVAPEHFTTLGIPLIRGRSFTAQDIAGRPRVAIISESAARRFWPDDDPVGQRVWFGGGSSFDRPDSSAEIVGIVGDVMYEPLDVGPNRHSFYTPYAQFTYGWRMYFVRTTGEPSAFVGAIRNAVHGVDPDVPMTDIQTLQSRVGMSWARQRLDAWFFGVFAVLAVCIAVSGIYAVVSYAVSQRTREMGIRLALGSRPGAVLRLVVREGMMFPLVGLVVGTIGALAVGGALRASLYGVAPTDLRVLGATIGLLLLAALVACTVPARRATKVDPCDALRAE
ncbi:MAG: ABC transporter permease [Gemmatimonadaceae bacterium]